MSADRPVPGLRTGVLLGLALLAAGWPRAGGAGDLTAVYSATWAGLPAAEIRLTLHDGAPRYDDSIDIRTRGLPHLFTHFRGTATATGRLSDKLPAAPSTYEAIYDLRRRRNRRINMRFVDRGGARVIERGPGDTSGKPPLPEKFRTNAVDPLSALERIRQALAAARGTGRSFTVPVYDGARRFDVVGHVLPKDRQSPGTLRLTLTLQPVAGFKGPALRAGARGDPSKGSSEDGDPDDAPRIVDLDVSDDARLLPLRLTVPIWYLPLTVRLDPGANRR
ncbi:MAG TPA: DUF3108 domain-containing protein [Stellaceae bacterium]|nr:DUF3108 domain-containing protein [Stellaceae bacterium]